MNYNILEVLVLYFVVYIKVEMCPQQRFWQDCTSICHCIGDVNCDVKTGTCLRGCAEGWDGISCQRENVAFKRKSKQKDGKNSNTSPFAIDGEKTTCSYTKPSVPGWWIITLDQPTRVENVKILAGQSTNIKGWKIYVGMDDAIFSMSLCTTVRIHGDGAMLKCDIPILGQYVMVVNRIGPVELCDFRIYVCSQFWFGNNCDKHCNCADQSEVCDPDTGACASGCSSGWSGSDCQTGCLNRYGENCKYPCGNCDNNATCDHVTGECSNGCKAGWTGAFCTQKCNDNTYGKNCDQSCGFCHGDGSCDAITGSCHHACKAGYKEPICSQECEEGRYGENCNFECGHCVDDTSCDTETGVCLQGCRVGWEGAFCTQECLPGYYGDKCSFTCSNCYQDICDVATGACQHGCAAGYIGDNCSQVCRDGLYGFNCSQTCGKCLLSGNGQACDVISGACTTGCEPGYNGSTCSELCPAGFYGERCQKCGVCAAGTKCDVFTGKCPEGCALNFYGDTCSQSDPFSDQDGPQLRIFLGATIGLVGGIMTLVIVCLVLMWQREHLPDVTKPKTRKSSREIYYSDQNGRIPVLKDNENIDYV